MTHSPSHSPTTSSTAPDTTEAAALRATLTSLLSDHVWLAGNALDTAVKQKGDLKDPQVVGAVKALDANSVALAKTLGSVYPDAEKPFLASWRQHIGFFVDYTLGKATKNDKQVAKAKADLDAYRTSFGELINSVSPRAARRCRRRGTDSTRRHAVRSDRRQRGRQARLSDQARHRRRSHADDRGSPYQRHGRQQEDRLVTTCTSRRLGNHPAGGLFRARLHSASIPWTQLHLQTVRSPSK